MTEQYNLIYRRKYRHSLKSLRGQIPTVIKDISARTVTCSELGNFNIYNLASENPRQGGGETVWVGVDVVVFKIRPLAGVRNSKIENCRFAECGKTGFISSETTQSQG